MLHQIGIGTLGPVFRTYEPSRDRLVAVKAFRLDIVPEQAQALAAALSRAAQASLFHPSIVEPIDAGLEGTVAYRAEEYVAAESLDVAMRHYAPAPIEKALPFITQLAGAIDFARAAGIGHGGLHPRDIFVTPDEARATGFGVVDALEQVGIRAPIRRPYSAPERIDGRAWTTQADVFSLAAITFELLTAKRPAGTGSEVGALPDGPHATALHAVLARAMHEEPAKRYASALAFAGALEAASQGRPLTDAVSQVTTIAAVPEPAPAPVPAPPPVKAAPPPAPIPPVPIQPVLSAPPPAPAMVHAEPPRAEPPRVEATLGDLIDTYEPELDLEPPVAAAGPLPLPRSAPALEPPPIAAAPALGEFDLEASLDPLHDAIDDVHAHGHVEVEPTPVPLFAARDDRPGDRFADEFVTEQELEPHKRSPFEEAPPREEEVHHEPPARVEVPMFRSVAPEPEPHETADHGRPAILPYALVAVPMLLVGFAAGYFLGSRDRITPESSPSVAQYSDQKVSTPVATAPAAAAPKAAETAKADEKKAAPPRPVVSQPGGFKPGETRPVEAKPAETGAAATPPARGAASQKGQIVVRSLPSHAGVTVNGTWRGRTPLKLDDLALGSYVVRVVQPGYHVSREEFSLSGTAPSHTVIARLERAAAAPTVETPKDAPAKPAPAAPETFTGSLYVDSRPRGANVLVDGKAVGQTPLTIPDVRAGSHLLRIEMDGKKPVTANPRISAGKTERVTVSLEDK